MWLKFNYDVSNTDCNFETKILRARFVSIIQIEFEPQPNIQVLKAYQNSSDEIRDFKSNYNCEFWIFLIHSRCKNHLWYSKNSIPKKNQLRALSALQNVKNHDFHRFWASFWPNPQCCLALSARGSARAPEISSDMNSSEKIDTFCTKNECKIFEIGWETIKTRCWFKTIRFWTTLWPP